ncbi:MAG: SLC13 family permease [Candidatus Sumerlaeia bacterium]|nr:SLC13 family permease [Candidatus Sumerlaeia bacterium]
MFTLDGYLTVATLVFVFGMLAFTRRSPDSILFAGLIFLIISGVLTPSQAFSGFSNEGILTVGVLYIVAMGLRESGGINLASSFILKRPRNIMDAQGRLMLPTAGFSAFLNNTTLVVMLLPVVSEWAKKFHIPVSKLLIPLSYASILGGVCTLIGTSTNLVLNGLYIEAGYDSLSFFEISKLGVPLAIIGIGVLLLGSNWLLPDRRPTISDTDDPREYVLEMMVEKGSPLEGKTIEEAGLRHLPGLYLTEIERDGEIRSVVGPEERLHGGDQLMFVGIVDSIVDLQRIRGLVPATDQVFKLAGTTGDRVLIEAVVSDSSPMVGTSIRAGRFRTRYDAAVIAAARNGERIRQKLGDVVLQPGDTLLIEALPTFVAQQKHSRDFFLVSRIEDYTPPRHDKVWLSLAIMAGLVISVTGGWLTMMKAALLAAAVMILTGCLSSESARKSIDWRVLGAIVAAFGIGRAMQVSGTAEVIATWMLGLSAGHALLSLFLVYLSTLLFTEMITNNAAAVLMFPIAMATATGLGVEPLPFLIATMVAASCGFATPLGYQTHLIVYGPGGYRFSDFLKVGIPMDLLIMVGSLILIPLLWPFTPVIVP